MPHGFCISGVKFCKPFSLGPVPLQSSSPASPVLYISVGWKHAYLFILSFHTCTLHLLNHLLQHISCQQLPLTICINVHVIHGKYLILHFNCKDYLYLFLSYSHTVNQINNKQQILQTDKSSTNSQPVARFKS